MLRRRIDGLSRLFEARPHEELHRKYLMQSRCEVRRSRLRDSIDSMSSPTGFFCDQNWSTLNRRSLSENRRSTFSSSSMSKGERESLVERFEEGNVDTIDTKARYLAYGARLKTALAASSRYLAYTSDVGEAFRPIVSPLVVKAAYGVSWAYLGLDVGYEGYKAVKAGKDEAAVGTMVVKRGIFQALASMAFPMMTIHSVVKYSAKSIFKHSKSTWGPTAMGLAVIPFLPYIFDEPVEHLVDKAFEPIERYVGSQTKVPHVAHQTVLEEKKVQ